MATTSNDGNSGERKTVSERIKELRRVSVKGKDMWVKYVVDSKHLRFDPALHEVEFLNKFMDDFGASDVIGRLVEEGLMVPDSKHPRLSSVPPSIAIATSAVPAEYNDIYNINTPTEWQPPEAFAAPAMTANLPAAFRNAMNAAPAPPMAMGSGKGGMGPGKGGNPSFDMGLGHVKGGVIGVAPTNKGGYVPMGGVIGARQAPPGFQGQQGGVGPGQTIGGGDPTAGIQADPAALEAVQKYLAQMAAQAAMAQSQAQAASSQVVDEKLLALTGLLDIAQAAEMAQAERDGTGAAAGGPQTDEDRASAEYIAQATMMASIHQATEEAEDYGEQMSAEVQQAAMMAQQALVLQQMQFQEQANLYEKQRATDARQYAEVMQQKPGELDGVRWRPMHLCKQHFRGECKHGSTCKYAHTVEELHPFSLEHPDHPSKKAQSKPTSMLATQEDDDILPVHAEPVMRIQRRQSMCQRHAREGCLLNERCPFAHTKDELGTVGTVIISRVKTQLCDFDQKGDCVYGKYCMKAHGMGEIGRPKPDYMVRPDQRRGPPGR